MPDPLILATAAGRALGRLAWRRAYQTLLPPVATALAEALRVSCESVDASLNTGFGDTLSSLLAAGHDEELTELTEILVGGDLSGDPDGVLQELDAELDLSSYDEISGTDTVAFLRALSPELRRQVERRSSAIGSPLSNWFMQLQMNVSLSMSRLTLDTVGSVARELIHPDSSSNVVVARPWQVPVSRTPWFRGREEVISFLSGLPGELLVGAPTSLSGLGGIGKTQAAVEFAHRYRSHFTAVFLVRAGSETRLRTGLADAAVRLGLGDGGFLEVDLVRRALNWFETSHHWLLIYDGADDVSFLSRYLPRSETGRLILTSRADCGQLSYLGRCLGLEPMTEAEATEFLLARSRLGEEATELDRASAVELASIAGGLPLALEQMGAYLAETGAPPAKYLASLRRRGIALIQESSARTGDYSLAVTTTWAADLDAVLEENPAAFEVLRVSTFWAPDRIPIELLVQGRDELGDPIRQGVGLDEPLDVYQLLQPLQRYSLLRLDPGLRSYSLHPLLHQIVREGIPEPEARGYARRAARALNLVFPSASFENWTLCSELVPHVQNIEPYVDLFGLDYEDVGTLLNEAASYLRIRGDYQLAEEMHLKTLGLARRSNNASRVATSLNNLAFVYNDVEEPERALPLFREALRLQRDELGEGHPDLWMAYNNLGHTCLKMGLVTEAFELIERALELAPNATDEDAYFRAFPLTGRAEILCALNRAEEALIDAEAALHARERSGNLQRISASHSAIGLTQLGLGDINGALGSLHKAVELSEEAYGSNHPVLRTPLRRLAKALRRAGNEQDATKIEMRYDELGRRLADLWPGSRQGSAEATK